MEMIRILTTVKNSTVRRMQVEGGPVLPAHCITMRQAACYLIGAYPEDTAVNQRINDSAHDSWLRPATLRDWCKPAKRLIGEAVEEAPEVVLRKALGAQPLPGRPKKGSKCGAVWDMMDELGPVDNKTAVAEGVRRGIHRGTVQVQVGAWRKAHAIKAAREKQ